MKMAVTASSAIDGESKQLSQSGMEKPASVAPSHFECKNIIGRSAPMLHVFNLIQQVASFDSSVLILGESGTGKEGVANCIVQQSKRFNKPYIKIIELGACVVRQI